MTLFADAGFYVALLNPRDRYHDTAHAMASQYDRDIVTTEYVLMEVGNLLSRSSRNTFVAFYRELKVHPNTETVPSSPDLFAKGIELFARRADQTWSVTDCVSFIVMRDRGISEALTFDRHFEQAGFHRFALK